MGRRVWPITALSAILVIAFGLLLISVLSVPVTKSITLCTYGGIQFGVFGYCDTKTNTCSSIRIGYGDVTSIDGFSLPSNARHTLASLLIVHVVAAGLTLALLLFTLIAHFPRAGSSSGYLLFILIFSLPCFLVSLLAFLVDILLFVPHLDWGGWIVLGSTVLIAIFGVFLCVLRRTTSSRKAVEQNTMDHAEMHPLGQHDNAFSGGISYKPTANSGDLIFANSIDGYKAMNNSLPQLGEHKLEANVSNYSAETDEEAPLTNNAQKRPISGYDTNGNNTYADHRRSPSLTRERRHDGPPLNYRHNEPPRNQASPAENLQQDYVAYPNYSTNQPSYQQHNDNSRHEYSNQSGNEINRHISMTSSIIPAGTYASQPGNAKYVNVDDSESFGPRQNSTTHSQYSQSNAPSYYPPQPPPHMQPSQPRNNPNAARVQGAPVQRPSKQPTINEGPEPSTRQVIGQHSHVPPVVNDRNVKNTHEKIPMNDTAARNTLNTQSSYSSEGGHMSNNTPRAPEYHQQGAIIASQRQDFLLQSNPDFQIADKPRPGRRQRNQKVPAASLMRDIEDSGPYGISKTNFR